MSKKTCTGRGLRKLRSGEDGWGGIGGYMHARVSKLEDQFKEKQQQVDQEHKVLSNIFSGVAVFVNGYTNPTSDEIKTLMAQHGGTYVYYYSRSKVTHTIASNLPFSKIRALKPGQKVVKPEWITDSIAAGRLLPSLPYEQYSNHRGQQNINFSATNQQQTEQSDFNDTKRQPGEVENENPNSKSESKFDKTENRNQNEIISDNIIDDKSEKFRNETETAKIIARNENETETITKLARSDSETETVEKPRISPSSPSIFQDKSKDSSEKKSESIEMETESNEQNSSTVKSAFTPLKPNAKVTPVKRTISSNRSQNADLHPSLVHLAEDFDAESPVQYPKTPASTKLFDPKTPYTFDPGTASTPMVQKHLHGEDIVEVESPCNTQAAEAWLAQSDSDSDAGILISFTESKPDENQSESPNLSPSVLDISQKPKDSRKRPESKKSADSRVSRQSMDLFDSSLDGVSEKKSTSDGITANRENPESKSVLNDDDDDDEIWPLEDPDIPSPLKRESVVETLKKRQNKLKRRLKMSQESVKCARIASSPMSSCSSEPPVLDLKPESDKLRLTESPMPELILEKSAQTPENPEPKIMDVDNPDFEAETEVDDAEMSASSHTEELNLVLSTDIEETSENGEICANFQDSKDSNPDSKTEPSNEVDENSLQVEDNATKTVSKGAGTDNQISKSPKTSPKRALRAGNPRFVSEFYSNSRLHHLSTWGAECRDYVTQLQSDGDTSFPGRRRLADHLGIDQSELDTSPVGVTDRVVMHIDMDCFFVAVGLRNRPDLKGKPVAVTHSKGGNESVRREGQDPETERAMWMQKKVGRSRLKTPGKPSARDDVTDQNEAEQNENESATNQKEAVSRQNEVASMADIASCSYEARQAGVKNGMFMGRALQICPHLQTIPYDFDGYNEVSRQLYDLVASYTHHIEAVSCDELFIDCSDVLQSVTCTAVQFAEFLRKEIYDKTKCTASAGLGSNILLARLATRVAKPNGVYHLTNEKVAEFMQKQEIKHLPGVGWSTLHRLAALGVSSCADLQTMSLVSLRKEFGQKTGQMLYSYCRGEDERPVRSEKVRKSVSAEINYGIRFTQVSLPAEFQQWTNTGEHLCQLIKDGKLRETVDEFETLNHENLESRDEKRLAYTILSFITSGYVWCNDDVTTGSQNDRNDVTETRVPPCLAVPLCALSDELGTKPIISHNTMSMLNAKIICPVEEFLTILFSENDGLLFQNLGIRYYLPGEDSMKHFVTATACVELRALKAYKAIEQLYKAMDSDNHNDVITAMKDIAKALKLMARALSLFYKYSDPKKFYQVLRPFIASYGDQKSPYPNGVIFESVSLEPVKLRGASAAQSCIFQCLDAILGVEHDFNSHEFLSEVRDYMFPSQRKLLEHFENRENVRDYVQKHRQIQVAYDDVINEFAVFRSKHVALVSKFILDEAEKETTRNESLAEKGTGGQDLREFLSGIRKDTTNSKFK